MIELDLYSLITNGQIGDNENFIPFLIDGFYVSVTEIIEPAPKPIVRRRGGGMGGIEIKKEIPIQKRIKIDIFSYENEIKYTGELIVTDVNLVVRNVRMEEVEDNKRFIHVSVGEVLSTDISAQIKVEIK